MVSYSEVFLSIDLTTVFYFSCWYV